MGHLNSRKWNQARGTSRKFYPPTRFPLLRTSKPKLNLSHSLVRPKCLCPIFTDPKTPAVIKTTHRRPRLRVNAKTSIPISVRTYTASVVCLQRKQANIKHERRKKRIQPWKKGLSVFPHLFYTACLRCVSKGAEVNSTNTESLHKP